MIEADDEVLPGLKAMAAPGHTPGHLAFLLSQETGDVIFAGDSAKNRAELLSMTADATMDIDQSRETMAKLWALWRRGPENLLIPGHDMPMVLKDGMPTYIGRREAAIAAWRGDDLDQITTYDLTIVEAQSVVRLTATKEDR
jgi:glyoxylase-like metal-dependent hydrolase (beta-lactamase superfamily II)